MFDPVNPELINLLANLGALNGSPSFADWIIEVRLQIARRFDLPLQQYGNLSWKRSGD